MQSQVLSAVDQHSGALRTRPWVGVSLAATAAAVTWILVQSLHPLFHIPEKYHAAMGAGYEAFAANRRAQDWVEREHAMLYIGGLGLLLAGLIGSHEGVLRRSWRAPAIAAPLGAIGGAWGGFLGCLMHEYVRQDVGQAELSHTVGAQLLVSLPLGLGVGLGLGLATRTVGGVVKTALGGIAGGILAAVVYPVAVSVMLPATSTDSLLPDEAAARLLWLTTLSTAIGLTLVFCCRQQKAQSGPMASPP